MGKELVHLLSLARRAYEGKSWHGPALGELLATISAEQAAVRPPIGSHSIWQLALHITAWKREVCRCLRGEAIRELTSDENWPAPPPPSESAWTATVAALAECQRDLLAALEKLQDEQLDAQVAGAGFKLYSMVHGAIHHDLYHAGQIALLRSQFAAGEK